MPKRIFQLDKFSLFFIIISTQKKTRILNDLDPYTNLFWVQQVQAWQQAKCEFLSSPSQVPPVLKTKIYLEFAAPPQGVVACNFNPDILKSHVYEKTREKTTTLPRNIQNNFSNEKYEKFKQNSVGSRKLPSPKTTIPYHNKLTMFVAIMATGNWSKWQFFSRSWNTDFITEQKKW